MSGKDRGAVPLAGHSGKAFWFSTNTGDFVTSRYYYYYESYPDWAKNWNRQDLAQDYAGQNWKLLNKASTYLFADRDDRPYEMDLKGYGRVFPHPFGEADHPLFNTPLLISPVGDRLTADFGKERFGIDKLVRLFYRPYLYLDDQVLTEAGLDRDVVAAALAEDLALIEGIALAVPRPRQRDLSDPGPMGRVQRNYHPEGSGDIYLAQNPYWFLYEKGAIAVMHGSPWSYDTFVPILFAGPGIRAQKVHRLVHPVDIAPTMSALLGAKAPAGARGEPLVEVLSSASSEL